jgi:hypothetical protein
MATIQIFNFSTAQVRGLATTDGVTLAPKAATAVDAGFWSTWQQQNATSTLLTSHTIFPA